MYEPPNPIKEFIAMVGVMIVFAIVVILMLAMLAINQILAALPWLILATGLSAAAIIYAIRSSRKQPESAKIIERQIVYVLPSDRTPRREVWQALADNQADVVMIEDGKERN